MFFDCSNPPQIKQLREKLVQMINTAQQEERWAEASDLDHCLYAIEHLLEDEIPSLPLSNGLSSVPLPCKTKLGKKSSIQISLIEPVSLQEDCCEETQREPVAV
jgi:hypothetical protein